MSWLLRNSVNAQYLSFTVKLLEMVRIMLDVVHVKVISFIMFHLGKSSSAKMALCCWGAQNTNLKGSKSTISAIVNCASHTTIPIVLDDISSQHAMEEMAVQFTGGATYSTVGSGTNKPKTSIIVTANHHFADSDRLVLAIQSLNNLVCACTLNTWCECAISTLSN